jgi:hypothetical protein
MQKENRAITNGPLEQWYSTGGTRTPGSTRRHLRGYVDYTICITCIMYQQLWGAGLAQAV